MTNHSDGEAPPPAGPEGAAGAELVVAVGVAPDGLEALLTFLNGLPGDLPAVTMVMPGTADGAVAEALRRAGRWPLVVVESDLPAVPGAVYLVPPDTSAVIRAGRFRLRRPLEGAESRAPVDGFFRGLANACGPRTVAVLLSAAGGDGALGLQAVGGAGGMTMALPVAPNGEAAHAAGVLGLADHLLPPADLAAMLRDYTRHYRANSLGQGGVAMRREVQGRLLEICDLLRRRTKHDFRDYKTTTLLRRLQRRMQVLRIDTVDAYLNRLSEDAQEPQILFRELLIGVTAFFRDAEAFAALQANALGPLFDGRGRHDQIRIWVPGCATGEEAYSIAMLVREQLDRLEHPPTVQIFATDIDERALTAARRGSFPASIASQVPPERLRRFFVKRGRRYQVSAELRELCLFSLHNLISDPPFPRIDLISCRNLLIYFGPHLQKKIIPIFHYALRPGGYLFLGVSETLAGHGELFRAVDGKNRVSQRKDTRIRVPGQLRDFGGAGLPGWREQASSVEPDLGAVAQRILLDEFTPEYAIVGEEGQVLYLSEGVERFVQPPSGTFSSSIMRMARRGLGAGLRTALHEAVRHRRTVIRELTAVHTAAGVQAVRLTVQPMPDLGQESGLYMVVFQEGGHAAARGREEPGHPETEAAIEQLERELQRTREDLERTVQDLEAANEELKSSNEELLSMNEELQSANEELESSKEEVQAANRALAAANADLENLLRSTRIATIFLDGEGNIRSFTPAASEIYNLVPGDAGRPLAHFTHRLRGLPPLPDAALDRADDLEDEAQSADGRWYLRRVLPYRGAEGGDAGVVITFIDITQLKRTEQALRESEARLSLAQVAGGVGSWDWDLASGRATCSDSYFRLYGLEPGEQITRFEDLFSRLHPEDRARAEARSLEALESGVYEDEYRVVWPTGEVRWLGARGVAIRAADGRAARFIGVNVDLTERRRAEEALRKGEARLRIALTAGRMGVWDWDLETGEVHWDVAQYQICGLDPTQPVRTIDAFIDLVHPSDRDGVRLGIETVMREGGDYQNEFRVLRPDGQVRWLAGRGARIADQRSGSARLVGVNYDVTARKRAEERQRLLMAELDHRVKNMLAVVQSLITQTRNSGGSADEFALALERRIQAMARTHVLLTQSRWAGANLHDILSEELLPFRDSQRDNVRVEGESMVVKPKAATALSLAFHELVTNAAKYGALSVPTGMVDLTWERNAADFLVLRWIECGGPRVEEPRQRGFGTVVVERNLAYELNARAALEFATEGLRCTIEVPMDQLVEVHGVSPPPPPAPVPRVHESLADDRLRQPLRILVVEDNALVAMGVEMAVEQLGWHVVGPAGHLADALALAGSEAIDAAVLDVNLDGTMVFPVAETLAQRGIPFMFATGYDAPSVLPEMFLGSPTVSKPFGADDLIRGLTALIASTSIAEAD